MKSVFLSLSLSVIFFSFPGVPFAFADGENGNKGSPIDPTLENLKKGVCDTSLSRTAIPNDQELGKARIEINVGAFNKPVPEIIKEYVKFLEAADQKILGINITQYDGTGEPRGATIDYVAKFMPSGDTDVSIMIASGYTWSGLFESINEMMELIKLQGKTVYGYQVLTLDGTGTHRSARIVYF